MKKIKDKFTHLKVSKQRKWQLRKTAAGLCLVCGDPIVVSGCCLKHAIQKREWQRERNGSKRRNNSKTYRMAA